MFTYFRKASVEDQLSSETNRPAMTAQLHLPALDLSWALNSPALHFFLQMLLNNNNNGHFYGA